MGITSSPTIEIEASAGGERSNLTWLGAESLALDDSPFFDRKESSAVLRFWPVCSVGNRGFLGEGPAEEPLETCLAGGGGVARLGDFDLGLLAATGMSEIASSSMASSTGSDTVCLLPAVAKNPSIPR